MPRRSKFLADFYGLGFGQLAFPHDALVRFVAALNPIYVLASITLRQPLGDFIDTAGRPAQERALKLYDVTNVKFVAGHELSTPTQRQPSTIIGYCQQCLRSEKGPSMTPIIERKQKDRLAAVSPKCDQVF
jgi:hypothetical protein